MTRRLILALALFALPPRPALAQAASSPTRPR